MILARKQSAPAPNPRAARPWHEARSEACLGPEADFGPEKPPNPVGFASGTHMTDKHRQRTPTPNGFLPNWALVVLVACAIAVVGLARTIV